MPRVIQFQLSLCDAKYGRPERQAPLGQPRELETYLPAAFLQELKGFHSP